MPIKLITLALSYNSFCKLVNLKRRLFSGSTDIVSDIIFSRVEISGRPRKLHKFLR